MDKTGKDTFYHVLPCFMINFGKQKYYLASLKWSRDLVQILVRQVGRNKNKTGLDYVVDG